jgi:hypothetical protein
VALLYTDFTAMPPDDVIAYLLRKSKQFITLRAWFPQPVVQKCFGQSTHLHEFDQRFIDFIFMVSTSDTGSPKNGPIFASCKMPEFFEMSPLSGAGKHPDFQVTLCHHFVTTNVDFAYIESE